MAEIAKSWKIGEDVIFHNLRRRNNTADIEKAVKRRPDVVDVLNQPLLEWDEPNYNNQMHCFKMVEIRLNEEIEKMKKEAEDDNNNTVAMNYVNIMFNKAEDDTNHNSCIRKFLKTLFMSYKNMGKEVKFEDELKSLFPELNKILGYVEVRLTHELVQHEIDYLPRERCNGFAPDDMMTDLSKITKKTSKYIILDEQLDESYEGAIRVVCWILHSMCEAFGQNEKHEQWDTFYTEFTYDDTSNDDYDIDVLTYYKSKVNSRMTSSTLYTTINAEYITYDKIRLEELSNEPIEYKSSLCVQNGKMVLLIDVV
jgi:hypothetical protein